MPESDSVAQKVSTAQDWPRVLDEHDVQYLVLDIHSDSDLLKLFRTHPGWQVHFRDAETVIFTRADTA